MFHSNRIFLEQENEIGTWRKLKARFTFRDEILKIDIDGHRGLLGQFRDKNCPSGFTGETATRRIARAHCWVWVASSPVAITR